MTTPNEIEEGPKRRVSVLTILTRAAKQGAHLRAYLPDGTVIETVTADTPPVSPQVSSPTKAGASTSDEWDKWLNERAKN